MSRERDHGQKELAKVQVVWGFGRAGRRARAAGRYGMIWLSRNLRSKLFKLFCCTYLVKRVISNVYLHNLYVIGDSLFYTKMAFAIVMLKTRQFPKP